MIYIPLELEDFRLKYCPKCKNSEPSIGEYCEVCGVYLMNECAKTYYTDDDGDSYYKNSCHTILDGKSRYCHNCGNESTFMQNGFLKPWDYKEPEEEFEPLPEEEVMPF